VDLSSEVSRGDFNETIATLEEEPLRAEVRLLRAVEVSLSQPKELVAARHLNMWTMACREQACTQFVSSSDNYAIMPTFLPSHLVPLAPPPSLISKESR